MLTCEQSQPSIPTVLPTSSTVSSTSQLGPVKLMVIGSAAVDITAHSSSTALSTAQSTSPGSIALSLGGVGRNVAEAAHRALDPSLSAAGAVQLVSALGQDSFGRLLRDETERMGMRVDGLVEADMNHRTAACNLVLDSAGALVGGVADMEVVQALDGKKVIYVFRRVLMTLNDIQLVDKIVKEKPMMVALDGNMSESSLTSVLRQCVKSYTPGMSLDLAPGSA
jgi:pseudouridine-5'-phosphate glycosidase/pseudouridine kinase